jgi:hypothetical protein
VFFLKEEQKLLVMKTKKELQADEPVHAISLPGSQQSGESEWFRHKLYELDDKNRRGKLHQALKDPCVLLRSITTSL